MKAECKARIKEKGKKDDEKKQVRFNFGFISENNNFPNVLNFPWKNLKGKMEKNFLSIFLYTF